MPDELWSPAIRSLHYEVTLQDVEEVTVRKERFVIERLTLLTTWVTPPEPEDTDPFPFVVLYPMGGGKLFPDQIDTVPPWLAEIMEKAKP